MISVREKPPLRLVCNVTTPTGSSRRWAADEPKPENNPSGIHLSSTMPGGFEDFECNLPRKQRVSYSDLERLSAVTVKGVGGEIAWQGRLERIPRASDDDQTVNPQAVGYQAHLDDNNNAAAIYVDRSLENWQGPSRQRKVDLYTAGYAMVNDPSADVDTTTGIPALNLTFTGTGTVSAATVEAWYDAGPGLLVGSYYQDTTSTNTTSSYASQFGTASDDVATASSAAADWITGTNSTTSGTIDQTNYRYAFITFGIIFATPTEADHTVLVRRLTVWGDHGLPKRGTAPTDGLYASDVIAHAMRWAPQIRFTTGTNGSIKTSSFIIPHLVFREGTTVGDIITQANRYELHDWAVWEGPTLYYGPRGTATPRERRWRARVSPAKLQETGPQVDRVWNGVVVRYQDAAGVTKTVGPPSALVDTYSSALVDDDPMNPANRAGILRYATLDLNILSDSASAVAAGQIFLKRAKELDTSGQAQLVGTVQDSMGTERPAWQVRAGDTISFVDAADASYRRITKTSYDHDSRTNSIDLDAPPEGMDALLEQLSASLYLNPYNGGDVAGSLPGSGVSRKK